MSRYFFPALYAHFVNATPYAIPTLRIENKSYEEAAKVAVAHAKKQGILSITELKDEQTPERRAWAVVFDDLSGDILLLEHN